MTLGDFEALCARVRRKRFGKGYEGFVAQCPACDSKSQHLSVCEKGDGWLHLHCVRGHGEAEILGAMGLGPEDRRIPAAANDVRPGRPAGVEYLYVDGEGRPLFKKRRYYAWRDGRWEKAFAQTLPDGTPGVAGLQERAKTLFDLPRVREAIRAGEPVYVNEGEKACLALREAGAAATCQPGGADGARPEAKWLPAHTEALRGARLVRVVADRDPVGEAYAAYVAAQVSGVAARVEVVQAAVETPKADAFDHLAAGKGLDAFVSRPDLGPRRGLRVRSAPEEFVPVEIRHLVEPYLPIGKCVLFDADGGTGKTTMAVAWAAALSRGLHPLSFEPLAQGRVRTLYLHKGEDSDDEIETVYRANGGVPGALFFLEAEDAARLKFDAEGLRRVQETIEDARVGLVVCDALFYFLDGVVGDGYKAMDAVGVLTALNRVAAQTGAVFLNIRHTTKGAVGTAASNLGMGSVQFRNSHRGQLVARWHPDRRGVVVVTDEKGSLLNPRGEHFMYRRVDQEVQYLRNEANPFCSGEAVRPGGKLEQAKALLRETLTGQYVPTARVIDAAAARGIGKRTVETARAQLKVQSVKGGGDDGWLLHLPAPHEEDPFADP